MLKWVGSCAEVGGVMYRRGRGHVLKTGAGLL